MTVDRSTTDRLDVGRAVFLERVLRAWEKTPPGTRFGQLLVEALDGSDSFLTVALRGVEDAQLAEAIERYVLTRAG